jgi:hypothetical protein
MTTDTQAPGAFQALRDALAAIKCGPLSAHMGHVTSEENEDWRALDINCNSGGNKLIGRPLARAIAQSVNTAPALLAEVELWSGMVWALARVLNCLPSVYSDANQHVYKKAKEVVEDRARLAAEVDRLNTALEVARVDAEQWRRLYRSAINEANGLTNYVEDRPELRKAEKILAAIEIDARALSAARSTK